MRPFPSQVSTKIQFYTRCPSCAQEYPNDMMKCLEGSLNGEKLGPEMGSWPALGGLRPSRDTWDGILLIAPLMELIRFLTRKVISSQSTILIPH